jgi:hypothetical protein
VSKSEGAYLHFLHEVLGKYGGNQENIEHFERKWKAGRPEPEANVIKAKRRREEG